MKVIKLLQTNGSSQKTVVIVEQQPLSDTESKAIAIFLDILVPSL
jgi:hypothetical protein